jgi:hypothetical protein
MKALERWAGIAMINLGIVAVLGFVMRSKLLFPLPFINFKYTLHAHSHFAFSGWVSLALMALLIFRLLPSKASVRPVYKWILTGIFLNALGMLVSFLYQGYGVFSIAFSTIFIFVTYWFTYIFIKDLRAARISRPTRLLAVWSVLYLALSSAGPFTLGYLLAAKSPNVILYKDAIYTYLHLQYSGFFTLAIFALLTHKLALNNRTTLVFARLLTYSVIPSMFISYLWHYPTLWIRIIAVAGSVCLVGTTLYFAFIFPKLKDRAIAMDATARTLGVVALVAFVLKTLFQALAIIPSLGSLVFSNRPVIIGFLHLVLLGFVSVYILAQFIQEGLLNLQRSTRAGLWLFVFGILLNEVVLMTQGLGFMLMLSSAVTQWLLWIAAIFLMIGGVVMTINNMKKLQVFSPPFKATKLFSQL